MERTTKIVLISGIAVTVIAGSALLYFYVIKPKLDAKKAIGDGSNGSDTTSAESPDYSKSAPSGAPGSTGGGGSGGGGNTGGGGGSASGIGKTAYSKQNDLPIYYYDAGKFKEAYKKNKGEYISKVVRVADNGMVEGLNTAGKKIFFYKNLVDIK